MTDWKLSINEHLSRSKRPLIVILGPTASGKTSFSIDIAQYIKGQPFDKAQGKNGAVEVVNADSRQLYKYLDIGTAKITEEEMQGVPHHLIDVLDPKEESTAGWYQLEAQKVIDDVLERGSVPLLVGGSMLYISAIIDGLTMAPVPDEDLRNRLMEEYDQDQGEMLYKRLQEIDPESAERIHRNNKPRLVRAVEIFEITKKPKSKAVPQTELGSSDASCLYDSLIFGMEWPREKLVERINVRTKVMFDAGWIEEVRGLMDRGYTVDDLSMKSHGYSEIIRYIQNGESTSLEELQESISAKSRQYAKRQMTWWRGDSRIQWISQH